MKTLIAASFLALTSSCAFALDIYGGFDNPDLSAHYSPYSVEIRSMPSASAVPDALGNFYAGNPDVDNELRGYDPMRSFGGELYTSLDVLTAGNPDSGTGVRFVPAARLELGEVIAAEGVGEQGGV